MLKELKPRFENVKSYYRKAYTEEENNTIKLFSYDTLVCTINNNEITLNGKIKKDLLLSQTTLRHIKEFLKQYCFNDDVNITKKELLNYIK